MRIIDALNFFVTVNSAITHPGLFGRVTEEGDLTNRPPDFVSPSIFRVGVSLRHTATPPACFPITRERRAAHRPGALRIFPLKRVQLALVEFQSATTAKPAVIGAGVAAAASVVAGQ